MEGNGKIEGKRGKEKSGVDSSGSRVHFGGSFQSRGRGFFGV